MWPEHDCGRCTDGKRNVDCNECDWGVVTCDRCSGYGSIPCDNCDAEGKLVQANFITRQLRPSVKVAFQIPGLAPNKFKHGLGRRHFKRIQGT